MDLLKLRSLFSLVSSSRSQTIQALTFHQPLNHHANFFSSISFNLDAFELPKTGFLALIIPFFSSEIQIL